MSWLNQMASFSFIATAADNQTVYSSIQTTAGNDSPYVMTWFGYEQSSFDGYEYTGQDTAVTQFTADTTNWPNKIQWANDHRSWIRVTQPTGKVFHFYYRWTGNYPSQWPNYQHINNFTVQFAPIPEEQEVAPETFLKWMERLGHDDAFLRVSYKMQKKMMKAVGHLPPWDPRKIEELEQRRLRWRERLEEAPEVRQEAVKNRLMERWGIEEIPPITGELLDQIAENSRRFLEECLSPEELEFFDEHGHIKVRSHRYSNIFYIVKVDELARVERHVNNKLEERICIHSKWAGLPPLDTVAMKVLNIKHNEEGFLTVGNRTRVRN